MGITYLPNGLVNQVAHSNGVVWTQLADPTHMVRSGRFLGVDLASGEPREPQTWNRYSYVLGNPLKYVDPNGEAEVDSCSGSETSASCSGSIDVSSGPSDSSEVTPATTQQDVINFASYSYFVASGFANAFSSNFLFGQMRYDLNDPGYRLGQRAGDLASIPAGALEAILGGGGEVGGVALDLTGAGALLGVPVGVVSTAAIVHGGAASANGFIHFAQGLRRKPGSLGQFKGTDALRREREPVEKVVQELGLTQDQRKLLHKELNIRKEKMDIHAIRALARELFGK